jgi:hypothetical protein
MESVNQNVQTKKHFTMVYCQENEMSERDHIP